VDHLALYSRNCKQCGYLDPEESRLFEKCHFTKGNTECPAQEIQIAVVGEAKRLARQVQRLRASGNLEREAKLLGFVAKRSPAFRFKFNEWSK